MQRRGGDAVLMTLPFRDAGGNTCVLPVLAEGPRYGDIEIGVTSVRDEGLFSAQYPALRSSGELCSPIIKYVAARLGLSETSRPDFPACRQCWKVLSLLFVATPQQHMGGGK